MSLPRRFTGEVAWVAVGQVAGLTGRLAAIRLLTTLLAPAAFGEVVLLLGASALAANLFCFPLQQGALKFFPQARRDGRVPELRATVRARLGRSLGWLGAAGAAGWVLARTSGWPAAPGALSVAALWLLLAVDVFRTFEANLLNADRRQRDYALWWGSDAWARALGGLVGAWAGGGRPAGVLLGQAAAAALVYAAFLPRGLGRDRAASFGPGEGEDLRVGLERFGRPLVAFAALAWITGLADRYVVAAVGGVAAAGLYGAAQGLASQPFLGLTGLFVQAFRPLLFDAVASGDRPKERRILATWLGAHLLVGGCGLVLLVLLREEIVGVALGPAFRAGADLLPWIGAGYLLQGVQVVFETRILAWGRTSRLLVVPSAGAAATLVALLALVPRFGPLGAAFSAMATFAATSTVAALASQGAGGRSSGKGGPTGAGTEDGSARRTDVGVSPGT